eukprot:scaffold2625_cov277-Chaetoceros_neogracile.AAC.5
MLRSPWCGKGKNVSLRHYVECRVPPQHYHADFCMCKYTNTPFTLTYPDRAAGMLRLTVALLVSQQPVWYHDMSIRPVDTIAVAEFQNRKCEATSWNFFLGWSLVFLERPGTS